MQELEKIMEEIQGLRGKVGSECTSEDHYMKRAWEHCLNRVTEIIRKHMNDGWIPVDKNNVPDHVSIHAPVWGATAITYNFFTIFRDCLCNYNNIIVLIQAY